MRPILVAALLLPAAAAWAQTPPEKPVDHGPFTPQANQAYQGGGVVLQGQPGQPAPPPSAAVPPQTPPPSR